MNIRPLAPGDEPGVVACWRSVDEPNAPGAEAFRDQATQAIRVLVAEEDYAISGFVTLGPAWWYGPGMFFVTLIVRRDRWGEGIGGRLWSALGERSPAAEAGQSEIFTRIREDYDQAKTFARGRGFSPTGSVVLASRLEVTEANMAELAEAEVRLAGDGVSVTQVDESYLRDPRFVAALYDCLNETERTSPASRDVQPRPFDDWLRRLRTGLNSGGEVLWAALDGGRVIGSATLEVLDGDRLENGFTGVRVADRGRGIAKALKAQTIRWAASRGYRWILTGSEAGNDPMLSINQRIGYRRIPAMEEWSRTLPLET